MYMVQVIGNNMVWYDSLSATLTTPSKGVSGAAPCLVLVHARERKHRLSRQIRLSGEGRNLTRKQVSLKGGTERENRWREMEQVTI